MKLADYSPPTKAVPIGQGNTLVVRGLGLPDAAILVREHFPDLDGLWELISLSTGGNLTQEGFTSLATALVSNAPGFAANLIALAAGEEDHADKAMTMPVGVQISALLTIFELTFAEVGGPGKALGVIADLLKKKAPTIKTPVTKKPQRKPR